ncbi:heparinase II/III family protein [Acetobacter vaccinii]|uniref:Heparinase n=1 Tax=Acetobacter vaccinii TaxID=2592655 RepID=A0A5C1YKT1_9PROT|nr:heparinase II/III family protein [Acetobacter vaccinii]QEO16511.1 heparinase [Acetobacter vaccinii]
MPLRRWTRGARLIYAMRNPLGGFTRVPAAPSITLRDLWPGNAAIGERLVRNQTQYDGVTRSLHAGQWDDSAWPQSYRRWLQGFTWLRDLRELGAESARIKARTLVAQWMRLPPSERPVADPSITGARLAAWLGCYDFFAASADDTFRQNLMASLIMEARSIMTLLPEATQGCGTLTALKGLLATAVSLPDQPEFLTRYLRLIDPVLADQFHPDGGHYSRNPQDQFLAVRELAEMLYTLQAARLPLPTGLLEAANRAAPALRAMRHGDGGLALFNGSAEQDSQLIEHVLNRASRSRVVAAGLPDTGFVRMSSGHALVLADAAAPAPPGFDQNAHAGMLSFEFSSARQRLIVNCGSSMHPGWAGALRYPAAHSVLEMTGLSPLDFNPDGTVVRPPQVTRTHVTRDGAHWLEMTHNGYEHQGAGLYYRQLYLSRDGRSLRGEEQVRGAHSPLSLCIRFHLHPDIMVETTENGYLLHAEDESWLFQSDATISVEESVYLGKGTPTPTLQLVLTPPTPASPAPQPLSEPLEDPAPEQEQEDGAPVEHDAEQTRDDDITTAPPADLPLPLAEPLPPAIEAIPPPLVPAGLRPIHWALSLVND